MKARILRLMPLLGCVVLAVAILFIVDEFSVEEVLSFTPKNLIGAAAFMLLFYTVKSLTVFFPILILEIVCGHLFPTWAALLINLAGISVELMLPYGVGRISGTPLILALEKRWPALKRLVAFQQHSPWFTCFFLRAVNCLPLDVVSMYLGASATPFVPHLLGGLLGLLPGMVCVTLVGENIRDPRSPAFIVSIALAVLLSLGSVLTVWLMKRRRGGAEPPDE